jgi:prepilin-type N-terminal cleavage/methylation domain-containing protein
MQILLVNRQGKERRGGQALDSAKAFPRLRAGWTLIESIAVMAVLAILAAMVAPSIIKRVDRAAWTKETADLNAIGDALTQSILRTKTIPTFTNWHSAVASQMSLPVSAVLTNGRRYARAFLIDPDARINGNDLQSVPYTQTINGATGVTNARVMIVSSLAGPLLTSTGMETPAGFKAIWDTPEGGTPAGWTLSGDDLLIKKLNLEPLFHQLILVNHDPTNAPPAPFSIDRGTTNLVSSGPLGSNKYYLEGSDVWLLDSNFNVRTRYLLSRNISFIFESGAWRGQIQGGETFSNPEGASASAFLTLATAFYNAPVNPGAQSGASPNAVLVSMYTFMFDYVFWATQCPNFDYHGYTGGNPQNLPEYNMLNDIGSATAAGSVGKYSTALVK